LILTLTGGDALNPQQVFSTSPVIEGETAEEKDLLARTVKSNSVSMQATASIVQILNAERLADNLPRPIAIAHLARANRAKDPFDRFEAFFKVLELYAPQGANEDKFDVPISAIAGSIDTRFTQTRVAELRKIRNRIVHSLAYGGHLDPHNIGDIELVKSNLADIGTLATILIWRTSTPWRQ
jgi:hypothetical protein